MATEVQDAPDRTRYEATLDGALAGFAEYKDVDGVRVFTHTEVDSAFEGKGIGGALVRGALDDVRASGRKLVALCPFVRSWLGKHEDYADLVDHDADRRLRG
jgi:predicted GNAT family acetyltransferase